MSLDTVDTGAWGPGRLVVYNSIIYDNRSESPLGVGDIANSIRNSGASAGSSLEIRNSDYRDLSVGSVSPVFTGNLHRDPQFSRRDGAEYYLTGSSPCVDAGVNSAPNMPSTDLAGQPRPQDGDGDGTAVANMGCYEQVIAEGPVLSWLQLLLMRD